VQNFQDIRRLMLDGIIFLQLIPNSRDMTNISQTKHFEVTKTETLEQ